jgi:hypothetical protein
MTTKFLPDPLTPPSAPALPPPPPATDEHTPLIPYPTEEEGDQEPTIEDERRIELKEYQDSIYAPTHQKEEPLTQDEQLVVDSIEAKVGTKLGAFTNTVGPAQTMTTKIRINLDDFEGFFKKKFYKVKVDSTLTFEVNADDRRDALDTILNFIETELKGMILPEDSTCPKEELLSGGKNNITLKMREEDVDVSEFIPNVKYEEEEYDL